MSLKKEQRNEIEQYILWNIRNHPTDIVRVAQEKFKVSRTAILRYIANLYTSDQIEIDGNTRNRKYSLKPIYRFHQKYELTSSLAEDKVWRDDLYPLFSKINRNVIDICQYGFTEIFNNAIEHSEGTEVRVEVVFWIDQIWLFVKDNGIGIFNKIQKEYKLDDPMHAILELSKGKLTTEPESHTGEGIFFTSRMFDSFSIDSGNLHFIYSQIDLMVEEEQAIEGTEVMMTISPLSDKTLNKVFSAYTNSNFSFEKTIVPVNLARYGNENLVSRSQAKRLLARLEKFKIVVFDFTHIEEIGRAFADEIFRVFANAHPQTQILTINDNKKIKLLIGEIQENKNNTNA